MDWKDYQEIYQVVDAAYKILLPVFIIIVLYNVARFLNLFPKHQQKKEELMEKKNELMKEKNELMEKKNELMEKNNELMDKETFVKIPVYAYCKRKNGEKIECSKIFLSLVNLRDDIFVMRFNDDLIQKNPSYGKNIDWTSDFEYQIHSKISNFYEINGLINDIIYYFNLDAPNINFILSSPKLQKNEEQPE